MHIIDSHFHWRPRSVLDWACKSKGFPRAERDGKGGYNWFIREGYVVNIRKDHQAWAPLEDQLADMDALGHQIDVVCTIGPLSVYFSDLATQPCCGTKRWPPRKSAILVASGERRPYRCATRKSPSKFSTTPSRSWGCLAPIFPAVSASTRGSTPSAYGPSTSAPRS
jgi:hypothetical protein